ncbi:hypothetical protein [Paenibacillus arenosi]|uniref:Uncharacterized protein n=1 Tax=Paenibacillus arenosi TaxID=2774142 RepID=A0ABR9B6F1_9BACL|nr:hypothetical protein [Paenibacillus arenosi]MBD8500751.1 hypothetical protein [Paenibacillus arenosi]
MGLYPLHGGNLPNKDPLALALREGTQIVDVKEATPITIDNVQGRTLVNLMGISGRCEEPHLFTKVLPLEVSLDTSRKVEGNGSLLLVSTVSNDSYYGVSRAININTDSHYIAVAMAHNITASALRLQIHGMGGGSKFVTADSKGYGEFEPLAVRFKPSDLVATSQVEVQLWIKTASTNAGGCFDAIRIYEISRNEYDVIGSMTSKQIADRYPYTDTLTHVINPYVEVTGMNLCPDFTRFDVHSSKTMQVVSPQETRIVLQTDNQSAYSFDSEHFAVVPGQTYTLSADIDGAGVVLDVYTNITGQPILDTPQVGHDVRSTTFTVPVGVRSVQVRIIIETGAKAGTRTVKNPMLVVGIMPKSYQPQKRSLWALEAQLSAHPVTGTDADILYTGEDGSPYVLKKWEKVTLDGDLTYRLVDKGAGFKIFYTETLPSTQKDTAFVTKYDGTILGRKLQGEMLTAADTQVLTDITDPNPNLLVFSVSNAESGWGDMYSPTSEEIKAYFLGWKMFDVSTNGVDGNGVYNRTDSKEKGWTPLDSYNGTRYFGATVTVPNVVPSQLIDGNYAKHRDIHPYRLQYLKSKPKIVRVETYDTGASLVSGANVVTVGSGVILREKAAILTTTTAVAIGDTHNPTKQKIKKAIQVYKGARRDGVWYKSHINPHGIEKFRTDISHYDPTATYYITYAAFIPTIAATINVKVTANMRGTVTALVDQMSDVDSRLSMVEAQQAMEGIDEWIVPTLMHSWKPYADGYQVPRYSIDNNGIVRLEGLMTGGVTVANTTLFYLPQGYRPKGTLLFECAGTANSVAAATRIDVGSEGRVFINQGNTNINTSYLSISGISFKAEH